jgi:hypothetical protein
MTAADQRLIELLRWIADGGGAVTPRPNPSARNGYEYIDIPADAALLGQLAGLDYLDERFLDRVSLCPKCSSHHLNVREVCPGCAKPNIFDEVVLHHFRCGFVGRQSEFMALDGDRVCPKCARPLHHIGTEYDRLGKTFRFNECGLMFQDPPVAALCLSCGASTPADQLLSADVFSYSLTNRGREAARSGNIAGASGPSRDLPFHDSRVTRAVLEQEARRAEHFSQPFVALRLDRRPELGTMGTEELIDLVRGLRRRLRDVDVVGQVSGSRLTIILVGAEQREIVTMPANLRSDLGPEWEVLPIEVSWQPRSAPRLRMKVHNDGSSPDCHPPYASCLSAGCRSPTSADSAAMPKGLHRHRSKQSLATPRSDDHAETSAAVLDARAGVAGGAPLRVRLLGTRPPGPLVQN